MCLTFKILLCRNNFTAFLNGATNNIVHNALSTAVQARHMIDGDAIPGISIRNNEIATKNRVGIISTHIGQAA